MKGRWRTCLYLAVGIAAVLVVGVEGVANPFTAWNLSPLLLALFTIVRSARRSDPPAARERVPNAAIFAVAVISVVTLGHLACLLDWRSTATGSSTSALLFVLLPLLAVSLAAVVSGVAAVLGRRAVAGE